MKTTQERVLIAYAGLGAIRQKVKGVDALSVFHLKTQLEENVNFQIEEEHRLCDEYGGSVNAVGSFEFKDESKRPEFNQAVRELREMEVDLKADIPTISLSRCPEITLEDIEKLNGFINWKG